MSTSPIRYDVYLYSMGYNSDIIEEYRDKLLANRCVRVVERVNGANPYHLIRLNTTRGEVDIGIHLESYTSRHSYHHIRYIEVVSGDYATASSIYTSIYQMSLKRELYTVHVDRKHDNQYNTGRLHLDSLCIENTGQCLLLELARDLLCDQTVSLVEYTRVPTIDTLIYLLQERLEMEETLHRLVEDIKTMCTKE